jgi:hypothetical protein
MRRVMRQLRATTCLLVLMAGVALHAAARADTALEVIDACVKRLDAEIDEGFARVSARCPQLAANLRSSDWAAWLPVGWDDPHNTLSAKSLAVLHTLVAGELALRKVQPAPDVARLRPILANLAGTEEEHRGFWARLQAWLRSVLATRTSAPTGSTFARLFGRVRLPQALLQFVSYATVVTIVGLAGFIVANEWRAAGMPVRSRRRKSVGIEPGAKRAHLLSWQDIEAAADAEQPRMLLEILAARLTAAQRLPAAAALTVRELSHAAKLTDAEDRARLLEVALASERLRYSAHGAAPSVLAAVMVRGRHLLERLDAYAASS